MSWSRAIEIYAWDSSGDEIEQIAFLKLPGECDGKKAMAKIAAFQTKLKAAVKKRGNRVWVQTNV